MTTTCGACRACGGAAHSVTAVSGRNITHVVDSSASRWLLRACDGAGPRPCDRERSGRARVFPAPAVTQVKAMACELPEDRDVPQSRWSAADLAAGMTSGSADDISIYVQGDVAWAEGRGRFTRAGGGGRPVRMAGVFVREEGRWKVVQSYASNGSRTWRSLVSTPAIAAGSEFDRDPARPAAVAFGTTARPVSAQPWLHAQDKDSRMACSANPCTFSWPPGMDM